MSGQINGNEMAKSGFVQSLNPMTGKTEWKMIPEDYDYHQEVARAAFADMLHDSERVRNFFAARLLKTKI